MTYLGRQGELWSYFSAPVPFGATSPPKKPPKFLPTAYLNSVEYLLLPLTYPLRLRRFRHLLYSLVSHQCCFNNKMLVM